MKRKIYYVIVMIGSILLISGCSKEVDISLDFIKEPDAVTISSVDKLNELSELGEKLRELSESHTEEDKKEVSKLMDVIRKIQKQAIVKVTDKSAIHKLINDIKTTEGPFYKKNRVSPEDIMFKVDLRYDSLQGKINNNNLANYFKEGYILTFMVFNDETIGLYIYSENSERNLKIIQLKVSTAVITQIKTLYNTNTTH